VTTPTAEVGVFGGSGFYAFLDDVEVVEVETPYGPPSAPTRCRLWSTSAMVREMLPRRLRQ